MGNMTPGAAPAMLPQDSPFGSAAGTGMGKQTPIPPTTPQPMGAVMPRMGTGMGKPSGAPPGGMGGGLGGGLDIQQLQKVLALQQLLSTIGGVNRRQ